MLLSKIKRFFVRGLCDHKYSSDTQIRVIRCDKCGDERWYNIKNLF